MHWVRWAFILAILSAGKSKAAKIAIIAMTTSSSIRVNALKGSLRFCLFNANPVYHRGTVLPRPESTRPRDTRTPSAGKADKSEPENAQPGEGSRTNGSRIKPSNKLLPFETQRLTMSPSLDTWSHFHFPIFNLLCPSLCCSGSLRLRSFSPLTTGPMLPWSCLLDNPWS